MKKNSRVVVEYIKENKENVVFIVYLLLTFLFLVLHQNFRDEAQAWLIATHCDFGQLVSQMKYEGHFLLWYLILFPFAKLGFPYCTVNVISWIFTAIAGYLLVHKCPFSFFVKVMILFSFPFVYGFSVFGRCYCLLPLGLILSCIYYKDRIQHPFLYCFILVFLFNIHITFYMFPFLLFLDYVWELRKNWKELNDSKKRQQFFALFLLVVMVSASLYPLLSSLSACQEVVDGKKFSYITLFSIVFSSPPYFLFDIILTVTRHVEIVFNETFGIGILILSHLFLLYLFCFEQKVFRWFYPCYLYQSFIFICIYSFNVFPKVGLLFLLFPICWILSIKESTENKERIERFPRVRKALYSFFIGILCLHSIVTIFYYTVICSLYPYSYVKDMAEYINQNIPSNSIICMAGSTAKSSSLIPYLKKDKNIRFYHIPSERFYTYTIWDAKNRYILDRANLSNIKELPDVELFYLRSDSYFQTEQSIIDYELQNAFIYELENKNIFQLVAYKDGFKLIDEGYVLYKINRDKLDKVYNWK